MKLSPQEIKTLLEDLYKTDPSLRERENDLIKIVQAIASSKPDVKMDKTFLSSLRNELLNKAKTLSKTMKLNDTLKPAPKARVSFSKFWPAIGFTFSGVAVGVMAMLFVMQDSILLPKKASVSTTSDQQQVAFNALSIDRVAKFAFGALNENNNSAGLGSAKAMGGGGGNAMTVRNFATESAAPNAPSFVTADGSVSQSATAVAEPVPAPDSKMMIMPPYEQTITEYVYKGDSIELKDSSLDVYKRVNSSFSTGNLASAIRGLNLGIANISSFRNANVSDISIYQDEEFGYQIYLSPRNGMMSIDQNWEKWQSAYPNCQDDACWKNSQLKESDVPSDEEIAKIADAFLAEHGIDHSAYGAGEVDTSWKLSQGSVDYIPDVMTVTYPLIVDKQMTYANGGMKMGITVSVNLRVKKVSSVYNIQALKFEASTYDAESDTAAILESAKNGGLASPIRYMDAQAISQSKKVEAELGTPVVGLVQMYQYKDNQSIELYVPALIFPVTKKPEGLEWSQNSIIVPLVKGFEDELNRPMPYMMKGGEGSSSSGSSGGTAVQAVPVTAVTEPAPALIDPSVKR